ncbi:MAG: amino acid ABC transporter permease, partial [Pseudomonadota bacterium]
SGFGFLDRTAGFDISQKLISYETTSTYFRAFLVGLTNTLLVAGLGIILATVIGFGVGIARLSKNRLIQFLATAFVELIRNIPPLLMLFFIYFGVLKNLPQPRESIALPLSSILNVRGLYVPAPILEPGSLWVVVAICLGVAAAAGVLFRAMRHQQATGEQIAVLWPVLALVFGLPIAAIVATGFPMSFDVPQAGRFNVSGGVAVQPEFMALLVGLSLYTAAFIAEIVRSGILGVPSGQTEAAAALGLHDGQVMRFVVIPQAMRIIIPPLTNQYLNLTKNSSLAVAIGYPDLVSVFGNTVLSQTNQAVEVILIIMAVYLTISLVTSVIMNVFNRRMALVER